MKNILALSLIVIGLLFISCSDDDSDNPTNNNPADTNDTVTIVGTWILQTYEVTIDNEAQGLQDLSAENYEITFNENKLYEGYYIDSVGNLVNVGPSSYSIQSDTMRFMGVSGGIAAMYIYTLTKETLTVVSEAIAEEKNYAVEVIYKRKD